VTTTLAAALLAELGDEDLDRLAELLAPRLITKLTAPVADRWLRGADQIAQHIDCPRSRVYALASAGRIPVQRDGSALIARTAELDAWLSNGGGKRP
jgi:hypothetical protein